MAAIASTAVQDGDADSNTDNEYIPPRHQRLPSSRPPVVNLTGVAEALDSGGVGARKASKILTELSVAIQGPSADAVIVKKRVQTALDKTRAEKLETLQESATNCKAVFCDGRDDINRCFLCTLHAREFKCLVSKHYLF